MKCLIDSSLFRHLPGLVTRDLWDRLNFLHGFPHVVRVLSRRWSDRNISDEIALFRYASLESDCYVGDLYF